MPQPLKHWVRALRSLLALRETLTYPSLHFATGVKSSEIQRMFVEIEFCYQDSVTLVRSLGRVAQKIKDAKQAARYSPPCCTLNIGKATDRT